MTGFVSTHSFARPVTSPATRAGTPTAIMPSGTTIPGGTVAPAAIRARRPTTTPSRTVAPLPTSASVPMTAPCTTQRWPTVAPSSISVTGSSPPCSTEPSWMFAPCRTTIGPKSARSTAPYQTEASASTRTSPTRVAVGAIQAPGLTCGSRPSKANSGIRPSCTRARPRRARPGWAGRLRLWLGDVDQPGDAELVDAHAELVAPDLLLQRHLGDSARGQLLEVAAQHVAVVAGQAHREPGRGLVLHVAGHVGNHERVAGAGLELPVHDLAGVGRVGRTHVAERHDVELAAEHALVELQRLTGGAVEVEVRIQPRGHGLLPEVSSMSGRYPLRPTLPGGQPGCRASSRSAP